MAMQTYDACGRLYDPGKGIDSLHMRRLIIPGAVFSPVGRRHFLPRVVESVIRGKSFHLIPLRLPRKEVARLAGLATRLDDGS
jgi:hypothetical protein